jgi:hypothetical protein
MTSIEYVDLDTYCGRVGNLYVRHGLCPPFMLRQIAATGRQTELLSRTSLL